MASIVSICNDALSNIGKQNISDLNEASAEARACNQFYTNTLDTLLQSYPWRWAEKTQALAEIANSKSGRWAYAYARPSDCLKIKRVTDVAMQDYVSSVSGMAKAGGFDYAVEGRVIYCDLPVAYLEYTARIADPSLFPPLFVEALSWQLAVKLAMPLTRDPKIRADAYQLAQRVRSEAQVSDANEVRETHDHVSEVIEARGPDYTVAGVYRS
jgi:hypothetical protein